MDALTVLKELWEQLSNNAVLQVIAGALASALGGTGIFAFLRRSKSSERIGEFFTEKSLLYPPVQRPAYSDRMAHVLAEMSDLAYYEFEGKQGVVADAVATLAGLDPGKPEQVHKFLEQFSADLLGNRILNLDSLKQLLKACGFEFIQEIDIGETQGFACKRVAPAGPSYVVIAFRGTEKKISDWLTDANAKPTEIKGTKEKVHTGFWEAFTKSDAEGQTVMKLVKEIMERKEAMDDNNKPLPLFITGHSLGGAIALLATKQLAPTVRGACYTFGAPRVANYEYFKDVKTPIYRVVNSSDMVPRVPPGAGMTVIVGAMKLLSWATGTVPQVSKIFDRLETFFDKLSGYRHAGDQRYLTDVAAGKFENVRLLSNPPAVDRALWMARRIALTFSSPVQAHSMTIYRRKLKFIATSRNGLT